jgi:hypothetical protein
VACDEAIARIAQQTVRNPVERIEAIRDGFFTKR